MTPFLPFCFDSRRPPPINDVINCRPKKGGHPSWPFMNNSRLHYSIQHGEEAKACKFYLPTILYAAHGLR